MRKRNHRIWCRLNDEEYSRYQTQVLKSGLCQEAYFRKLITGCQLKEAPPLEYHKLLKQLMGIGNNLNQIATKANSLQLVNQVLYIKTYKELQSLIVQIQSAI